MDSAFIIEVLEKVAKNPDAAQKIFDSELSLPNIKFPTLGGEVFWTDLAHFNGYCLQQNDITKHARILDPNNIRIAWGTVNGMQKALKRIRDSFTEEQESEHISAKKRSDEAMEKLKKLKELLDMGAINPDEYESKKSELINDI